MCYKITPKLASTQNKFPLKMVMKINLLQTEQGP